MCPVRSVTYVSGRSTLSAAMVYAACAASIFSAVFGTFGTTEGNSNPNPHRSAHFRRDIHFPLRFTGYRWNELNIAGSEMQRLETRFGGQARFFIRLQSAARLALAHRLRSPQCVFGRHLRITVCWLVRKLIDWSRFAPVLDGILVKPVKREHHEEA
jgi:hypothetical protein